MESKIWEIVEKYYPNYYSCNLIARNSDLGKLLEKDYEDGSEAEYLLHSEFNGILNNKNIELEYYKTSCEIYEKTIENFQY
ncbi:MAG: hypothetical protein PF487_08960 [Bacteroidales bacterium]|jgi:hypothetical protein|nr:hypothetical protein [Bacteroidales bacterium]